MYMKSVSFTEFRQNASAILNAVERGESVYIQRHGRVIARLVPAADDDTPAWKRPGPRLAVKGGSLTQAILDERRREP